jgi:hypothetical protein
MRVSTTTDSRSSGDIHLVADDYDIPTDEVRAAIWYDDMNKASIDARIERDRAKIEAADPPMPLT